MCFRSGAWGGFEPGSDFRSKTDSEVESEFEVRLDEEDEARSFNPAWMCDVKVGISSV